LIGLPRSSLNAPMMLRACCVVQCAGRIRSYARDAVSARRELDEDEHVQTTPQDGVDGRAGEPRVPPRIDDPNRIRGDAFLEPADHEHAVRQRFDERMAEV
jgi:hypothetical protein